MKRLVKGGLLVLEDSLLQGDLLIENGKIARIAPEISVSEFGASVTPDGNDETPDVINAAGLVVLPGGIDVHTHFNIWVGVRAVDDFTSGTISAVFGGTTTIVDHMGFGPAGCSLHHQWDVYKEYTQGKCVADYGLHGVVQHVDEAILDEMKEMSSEGIPSFKIYLTYDYKMDDADSIKVLRTLKEAGGITTVHCENDAIIQYLRRKYVSEGHTEAKYHPLSRPPYCEAEAVSRMIALSRAAGNAPLYIVHVSTAEGAQLIREARAEGLPVFGETCPQYLFLDDSCYDDPVEGLKYILSPPIRPKGHQEALWEGIRDGSIQVFATDHCSFSFHGDKQRGKDDFTCCPNGAPAVELRMPLLFSEGVSAGKIDLNTFAKLTSTNPAQLMGMYPGKGVLREGSDADLVFFDPKMEVDVTHQILHDACDYTPYEGMHLTGWPVRTIIRGTDIVKDERLLVKEGFGEFIRRGHLSFGV